MLESLNYSKYVILEFNIAGNESIEQQQHLELVVNYSSNLHQKPFHFKVLDLVLEFAKLRIGTSSKLKRSLIIKISTN